MIHVKLKERQFRHLVRGHEVEVEGRCGSDTVPIRITLADISFTRMLRLLDEAIDESDPQSS